ncbi:MAG: cbb3-type cytochrome c oxidase subunit I [Rhodospirillales bacterium]|nr:cbb3-type cytochrome c oxidase subunit I [Rhodospirillales bacterium]
MAAAESAGAAAARRGSQAAAGDAAAARRAVLGWAGIGVAALAIAGAFAFLLAFSRIPGSETLIAWPADFFHKGLVIHVVFSFVVWFLAAFAALATTLTGAASGASRRSAASILAVAAAVVAMPLLFVPALLDRGEATLNNYIPAIIDPLYYAGLALLAVAVAQPAVGALAGAGRGTGKRPDPFAFAMAAAAVVYGLSLVCFGAAWALQRHEPATFAFNEQLFWGGGHVLQVLNTLLLIVAWAWLGARIAGQPLVPRAAFVAATAILLALAAAAPVFYLLFPPFSAEQTRAFTALQYGLGPAALIVAVPLALGLPRPWQWRQPEVVCLALSLLLFAVGGAFGLFVDGADTRTPAHYHGVIASVTLAFMGLFYALILPALGRERPSERVMRVQLHLFAWGQLAACIGLFLAGGHGAPRKVAGEAQGLEVMAARIGMGLNGIGGLIAIVGGILFVWLVAKALIRHGISEPTAIQTRFWR